MTGNDNRDNRDNEGNVPIAKKLTAVSVETGCFVSRKTIQHQSDQAEMSPVPYIPVLERF